MEIIKIQKYWIARDKVLNRNKTANRIIQNIVFRKELNESQKSVCFGMKATSVEGTKVISDRTHTCVV
jgi:hypothetical protein